MSLVWVTVRDYLRIGRYKKLGFFSKGNEFKNEIIKSFRLESIVLYLWIGATHDHGTPTLVVGISGFSEYALRNGIYSERSVPSGPRNAKFGIPPTG
jgi:hypothetical protein